MIKIVLKRCHVLQPDIIFEVFNKTVTQLLTYAPEFWRNQILMTLKMYKLNFVNIC